MSGACCGCVGMKVGLRERDGDGGVCGQVEDWIAFAPVSFFFGARGN